MKCFVNLLEHEIFTKKLRYITWLHHSELIRIQTTSSGLHYFFIFSFSLLVMRHPWNIHPKPIHRTNRLILHRVLLHHHLPLLLRPIPRIQTTLIFSFQNLHLGVKFVKTLLLLFLNRVGFPHNEVHKDRLELVLVNKGTDEVHNLFGFVPSLIKQIITQNMGEKE